MSQNRVVKTTKDKAEKITGPLHYGLNVIRTIETSQYSPLKMELQYEVVVPYRQCNRDDYCIMSFSSINVSGRGSKSYGDEIVTNLCNSFFEIETKEDDILYNAELAERQILTGYNEETLEAVYLTVRFIKFAKENEIDVSDIDEPKFVPTTEAERNLLYCMQEVNGKRHRTVEAFVMDNACFGPHGSTDECYELSSAKELSYLNHSDTAFIVDCKERVWVLQAKFTPVEIVQAEQDDFIVSEGRIYQAVSLFNTKGTNKYIAFKGLIYSQLLNVKAHLLSEVPEPVFETNLKANTGYAGSGVYSAVMIEGTKILIAPFVNRYVSHDRAVANVVVANNSIFSVVGRYSDVGFIREHYGFNDWIVLGVRPSEEYTTFYESFGDVPLYYCDDNRRRGQEKITITFFDKEFEARKPRYCIGDEVCVVKEKGLGTKIKGLKGVVIGLSENKARVELSFFGFFQAKFELDQIEKVQKAEPIHLDRIELTPEKTIEAILNERRITIVWEEGFEESSLTTEAFEEFYGQLRVEGYCLEAYLGGSLEHTIFLSNGEQAVLEAKGLISAGEFSYVVLDDHDNERGANLRYVIYNAKAHKGQSD